MDGFIKFLKNLPFIFIGLGVVCIFITIKTGDTSVLGSAIVITIIGIVWLVIRKLRTGSHSSSSGSSKSSISTGEKEISMNAEEYSKRAGKYFHEKNFDGAIADHTEVIKLEPDNPYAYYGRGLARTQKKMFDLAITDFTEAIRLEPNDGDFYFDRAGAYLFKGNNVLAISDLEMAVKIDPQKENYREALKEIKKGS